MNPPDRESLRHAVREVLATRPGAALPVSGIRRRIAQDHLVDFDFDDHEIRSALTLLEGLEQVIVARDSLGATEYFRASAIGILKHERNE